MTLTTRGALRSCDQNLGICTYNGNGPDSNPAAQPFESIQFFQPMPNSRKVMAFERDIDTAVPAPTSLAISVAGSGGTLPTGTYYYVVTAIDGAGGETTASNEVNGAVTLGQIVGLAWTGSVTAAGYNIYRGTAPGSEVLLVTGVQGTSYSDTGAATPAFASYSLLASPNGALTTGMSGPFTFYSFTTTGVNRIQINSIAMVAGATPAGYNAAYQIISKTGNAVGVKVHGNMPLAAGGGGTISAPVTPPMVNTTQVLSLIDVSNLQFQKPANVIYSWASGQFPPSPAFPIGAPGGSYSGASGGGTAINPANGNIVGESGPLPDQVPFGGLMILVLGNGLPPYSTDGTNANTIPLANTFTGAFPSWFATVSYSVGDLVQPSTPNGFVYIVTQAGISGSTEPTWPITPNSNVTDKGVVWAINGSNGSPAPRGAAHAINHAGSLWLWNTYPTQTSDNLDGPSILKMSDSNNPNSWNPVNVAIVGTNDGQQGMGMASFTIAESGIPPEGSLVLFKEFSTYQVLGVFGATDFAIQQAQTELGCIAPRTIKFVPGYGIMRLSHLGVAVFDGVRDKIISEEIRPFLFGDFSDISQLDFSWAYASKADLVALPPMYCMAIPVIGNGNDGRLTRICCYDLILKAWTIIDLPMGIGAISQLRIPGSEPVTVFGGWTDQMISRWQVADQYGWQAWLDTTLTIHNGSPSVWSFRTPSAVGQSANDRILFRRVLARGVWTGRTAAMGAGQTNIPNNATGTVSFQILINVDTSGSQTAPVRVLYTPTGSSTADSSVQLVGEIGVTGLNAYATISGVQAIGGAPIEIDEVDFQVVQRPVGTLVRV